MKIFFNLIKPRAIYLLFVLIAPLIFNSPNTKVSAWLLSQLGLNETYRVQHLSTQFTRVFLCIKVESNIFPTLIESQWPVTYLPLRAAIFPKPEAHSQGVFLKGAKQLPTSKARSSVVDCLRIQQAIWTQVDGLNRLWVMDIGRSGADDINNKGNITSCMPKLLVYDLLRNNAEVLRINCGKYIPPDITKVLAVKLGPRPTACQMEKYIYFLLANDSHILAYDIIEQKWQRRLLVSKKYEGLLAEVFPIRPNDLAFSNRHELLISDIDGVLYSTKNALLYPTKTSKIDYNADANNDDNGGDNNNIALMQENCSEENYNHAQYYNPMTMENTDGKDGDDDEVEGQSHLEKSSSLEMELLGSLLGPSRGMMIDHANNLFYVVPKFGAVVRCQYKRNLTAEDNEIIYLTSKNIQQIFFGSEDSVWLLTDRILQPTDHCFAGLN